MRTTFDLPADVTAALRRESARRGGRSKAPMNQLIAEAVRLAFGAKEPANGARIEAVPGRALVHLPKGIRITDADVTQALEDMF